MSCIVQLYALAHLRSFATDSACHRHRQSRTRPFGEQLGSSPNETKETKDRSRILTLRFIEMNQREPGIRDQVHIVGQRSVVVVVPTVALDMPCFVAQIVPHFPKRNLTFRRRLVVEERGCGMVMMSRDPVGTRNPKSLNNGNKGSKSITDM